MRENFSLSQSKYTFWWRTREKNHIFNLYDYYYTKNLQKIIYKDLKLFCSSETELKKKTHLTYIFISGFIIGEFIFCVCVCVDLVISKNLIKFFFFTCKQTQLPLNFSSWFIHSFLPNNNSNWIRRRFYFSFI